MSLSKSKSKTKPTAYSKPYIDAAGATLAPTYEKQSAIADSYAPGMQAASGFLADTIGGKYLGEGNPYLDSIVSASNRDITDSVNSNFMNRFGSGYHTNALVRGLGENEARLRGGEYDRERAYQNDAVGQYGQLAGQATALPGIASGQYASDTGGLFGQYMKTSTTTPWGAPIVGGLSNAAAAYFGSKAGGK